MRRFVAVACMVLVAGLAPGAKAAEACPPIDVYSYVYTPGSPVGPMGLNANGSCDKLTQGSDLRIITPGASYLNVRYLIEYGNVDALLVTIDGLGFENKQAVAYRMYPSGGYQTTLRALPGGPMSTLAPGRVTVRVQGPGIDVSTEYRTITSL